jgi:hypothetical protein
VLNCETVWSFWSYPCQENHTGLPGRARSSAKSLRASASIQRSNCRSWTRLKSRIHLMLGSPTRDESGARRRFPAFLSSVQGLPPMPLQVWSQRHRDRHCPAPLHRCCFRSDSARTKELLKSISHSISRRRRQSDNRTILWCGYFTRPDPLVYLLRRQCNNDHLSTFAPAVC